ncbi:TPA_asm: hypothetical protein G0D16_14125 [Salmonella bongori serovar 44:r:-]|uniref:Uncharacterized protein n=1 Tax=Salmonella bongori serovar 44:r:- TaxID=1967585 RepID=A0A702BNW9_SALBN|nr:hypothetical protein [Salmonella bongori serovar 44:r:-]
MFPPKRPPEGGGGGSNGEGTLVTAITNPLTLTQMIIIINTKRGKKGDGRNGGEQVGPFC